VKIMTDGAFEVDSSGFVSPKDPYQCLDGGCTTAQQCLADLWLLYENGQPVTWTIKIDDSAWAHTNDFHRIVVTTSECFPLHEEHWGGGAEAGERVKSKPAWRVLAHELCGHAWLHEQKRHPPKVILVKMGRLGRREIARPSHDPSVEIENIIAEEVTGPYDFEERGTYEDPHFGESLIRVTISGYGSAETATASDMDAKTQEISSLMIKDRDLLADVIGFAEGTEDSQPGEQIAEARAQAVRRRLTFRGVGARRFRTVEGNISAEPGGPARRTDVYMFVYEGASESHTSRDYDWVEFVLIISPFSAQAFQDARRLRQHLAGSAGIIQSGSWPYRSHNALAVFFQLDVSRATEDTLNRIRSIESLGIGSIHAGELDSLIRILRGLRSEQQATP
jgi:hypothetical protein